MTAPRRVQAIRVEAPTRWDAVDLAQRLRGLHTYLVQLGDRRWHVCVRCDGETAELVPTVRATVEQWARERHVDAVLRVGGDAFRIAH